MMLSRVAESIYWMGRYAERAENTARLVNLNMNLLLDMPKHARPSWGNMVKITGSNALFRERYSKDDERTVVRFLLIDKNNPGSMLSSLTMARENARTVRDIIPQTAWESLNYLYNLALEGADRGVNRKNRHDYLEKVVRGAQTLNGLLASTMLHDSAYSFLRMGRSLERADMTTRIIDELSSETVDDNPMVEAENSLRWMGLLKTLSAYQMYRREMETAVARDPVLEFLLQCSTFPRSVIHCLNVVEECLGQLPRYDEPLASNRSAASLVRSVEVQNLDHQQLHACIDDLQLAMVNINRAISTVYFSF